MSGALDRIVRRAQGGDTAALHELLGLLRGPLRRQVRHLGVSPSDVEDVVQEALMDITRGLRGYRWQASFLGVS